MTVGEQTKGWNGSKKYYAQSYDEPEVLDSAVLIMPLVFFCPASDPRFLSTLRQIMRPPERGGLSANSLVYRYDVTKSDDGVGGEEGFFSLCESNGRMVESGRFADESGMCRYALVSV